MHGHRTRVSFGLKIVEEGLLEVVCLDCGIGEFRLIIGRSVDPVVIVVWRRRTVAGGVQIQMVDCYSTVVLPLEVFVFRCGVKFRIVGAEVGLVSMALVARYFHFH